MSNDESSPGIKNIYQRFKKFLNQHFKRDHVSLADSMNALIEQTHDSQITSEEQSILKNIITFRDLEAADVMIPRTDIIAVPKDIAPSDLRAVFLSEAHTRLPVYNKSIDEIEGFIHLKDFFKHSENSSEFKVSQLTRDIIFIPGTMKVSLLLTKMKQAAIHIAIVLDEYGGTNGLITIEDVIEELVGDIMDEYDEASDVELIKKEEDHYIIDAKCEIKQLEKYFNFALTDGNETQEYDTVGGMIITYLGVIPKIGEKFDHPKGFEVEILDADNRRIKKVKIIGLNGLIENN